MEEFYRYAVHFCEMPAMLIYFVLSIVLVSVIIGLLLLVSKIKASRADISERGACFRHTFLNLSERFFEIVFSATSILLFMATYYLIERFCDVPEFREIWGRYKDFWLLFLIVLSCIINTLLDSLFMRLGSISGEEKATGRITGMIYMILIFCYIKFIYENDNYDVFITYFLGLMVGRFVYFDASFKDFYKNIAAVVKNIPLMLLGLTYTGLMCLYGFSSGYLIKHIGVITDTCITHIFMCVGIFIAGRIARILVKRR